MTVTPIVRGLYLCEGVTVHPDTRNLSLDNCFRGLRLADIPNRAKPFYVVAYLVGGVGEYTMTVRVNRLDTMAETFRTRTPVRFPGRLEEVRFVLRIEQCLFTAPGRYEVSLWSDREMLAQTPFTVRPLS